MSLADSEPTPGRDGYRTPYLSINPEQQALEALKATASFLEQVEKQPDMWKWAILALHNAVQGFMVLALTGSTNWGALRDEDVSAKVQAEYAYRRATEAGDEEAARQANDVMLSGAVRLAPFLTLYNRVKSGDWWMMKYTTSKSYVPRPTDDMCMSNLDSVRNEFAHFVPMRRGFLLTQFPAMTETGLRVIDFLARESGNITFRDEDSEQEFARVFQSARAALERIQTDYAELPLPAQGLCGAPIE
jgi:hypothetical protein